MLKTASKNNVPSPSYDFLKIAIYTTRKNLKSRYPKTALMYLLEKTTHPKVLKLGLYLALPSLGEYPSVRLRMLSHSDTASYT